jgi:hypothetical protein
MAEYKQYRKKGGSTNPENFELQTNNITSVAKGGFGLTYKQMSGKTADTGVDALFTCERGERIIMIKALGNGVDLANINVWGLDGKKAMVGASLEDGDEIKGSFLRVKCLDNSASPAGDSKLLLTISKG